MNPPPRSPLPEQGARFGRWQATAYLALGAALNYADRAAFSSVLPPLRAEFGLEEVQLGMLGSAFLWSYALASPLAGWLADRYSRSRIVIFSMVAWSLVMVGTAFARSYTELLLMRSALGLTESMFLPAAIALIADYHETSTRGRALSVLTIGVNFGVVAGGAGAGYLADLFSWRVAFALFGVGGIAMAALAMRFLDGKKAKALPQVQPPLAEALRYVWGTPSIHVLLLKVMLVGFTIWIFLNWLPLYFQEAFDLSLGASGFMGTFILQAPMLVGLVAGGWLCDVLSRTKPERSMLLLSAGYAAAAPVLLVFLLQPSLGLVVGGVAAYSLLRGLGEAAEKPALCEVTPPCFRATVLGLGNTLATASGGLGVFLAGWLKDDIGFEGIFAACAATFGLAAGIIYLTYRLFMRRDIARARAYVA